MTQGPTPAIMVQMLVAALRFYKTKVATSVLAFVIARVCDEMGIPRKTFCEAMLAEPTKEKEKP